MDKDFPRGIHTHFLRTTDAECGYKFHCSGAVRQVLTFVDKLAANDEERFVFCRVGSIVKHCKHKDKETVYSQRIVEGVLAYLRQQCIITPYFTHPRKGKGYAVMPHDAVFTRTVDGKNTRRCQRRFSQEAL